MFSKAYFLKSLNISQQKDTCRLPRFQNMIQKAFYLLKNNKLSIRRQMECSLCTTYFASTFWSHCSFKRP